MRRMFTEPLQWLIRPLGYEFSRLPHLRQREYPKDFQQHEIEMCERVRPYTMTSDACIMSLMGAVDYVSRNKIAGDFVECGVWKGGSMMTAALTLKILNDTNRNLWLYDTYEGMPPPTEQDVTHDNHTAEKVLETRADFLTAPLEGVKQAMTSTGYGPAKMHFIKGKVEDTIPGRIPERIALLRLDTDWYESTKHELIHLYPRLAPGGVIIIDDYGYWRGSREATDEYIRNNNVPLMLFRIDDSCRMGVKV
jgi:O-methyltransferase